MLRPVVAIAALMLASAVHAMPPPTTYYRSIGSRPDYSVGTVTAVNGETHVIGSLGVQWRSENRGRGDRITIGGVDYTIFSVDAENEITLTQPFGEPTTTLATYTISRKFTRLRDWEDCIEANGACAGVSSPSLSTDMRIEVGVVYADSPYMMNTGGERLQLDALSTDSVHTVTLTATPANRHHGVANTGVVLNNSTQGAPAIDIRTSYVTVEWIEIYRGDGTDQIFVGSVGSPSQIDIHNVILHDDEQNTHGLHVNDDEANVLFYNNILYGLEHGVHVNGLQVSSTGQFEFYYNTFFQNIIGLNSTRNTPIENDVIIMVGNLAHSNTSFDYDALQPNLGLSASNWSGDNTGPLHGPGGVGNRLLSEIQFISVVAPEDFHIQRTSILVDLGVTLSVVTEDIDGRPRGIPDIGADEADTSSANPVKIFTAKAATTQVELEWQNPDYGPMNFIEVVRDAGVDPAKPSDGISVCTIGAPVAGGKASCADLNPLTDGTPYFYSVFVHDFSSNYSIATSVTGLPFDSSAVPPLWTYASRAATFEPAGARGAHAFVVSNDSFFHSMQGDNGATGGEWPLTAWEPYRLPALVQHRPVIIDISGNATALLGAQDGRVYAVDIATGRLVWKSQVLGTSIDAAPAALVGSYGATGGGADKVYVGTSNPLSNSLFILDLFTGSLVDRFDDLGQPANIGSITGVAVKYPSGPVFFTSNDGSGGTNRNVWSVSVIGLPSPPVELWSDNPGNISAGPTLYQNKIFVGSFSGSLIGYNDDASLPFPLITQALGDGALKAPIFPISPNDTLIVSTSNSVNSVQFSATGGCGAPPCINWGQGVGAGATPALFVPGTAFVYAGNGAGSLFELGISLANPGLNPTVRGWLISPSALGGPSFSVPNTMMYVSDSSGTVHGIPWPIP